MLCWCVDWHTVVYICCRQHIPSLNACGTPAVGAFIENIHGLLHTLGMIPMLHESAIPSDISNLAVMSCTYTRLQNSLPILRYVPHCQASTCQTSTTFWKWYRSPYSSTKTALYKQRPSPSTFIRYCDNIKLLSIVGMKPAIKVSHVSTIFDTGGLLGLIIAFMTILTQEAFLVWL